MIESILLIAFVLFALAVMPAEIRKAKRGRHE